MTALYPHQQRIMDDINAAMQTAVPDAPCGYFAHGRWHTTTSKRPTSLMVHITGRGPRRVYRSDHTGRYYIIIRGRRLPVDPADITMMTRRET